MIKIDRNLPAPPCLAIEKEKANGDYKCGEVLAYLVEIFHNKCYICEDKEPRSINVEHFKPHKKKDKNLKFDWNNLFLCCSHCNNTKLAKTEYDDILDCTNPNHRVEDWIKYKMDLSTLKTKVQLEIKYDIESVRNTIELLDLIYNGHTPLKIIESNNLRKAMLRELNEFKEYIGKYCNNTDKDERNIYLKKIEAHLKRSSAFCAFKRWIVKENNAYMKDFSAFLD